MAIKIIAAMDLDRNIGYKNQLLCRLPGDLKHFKQLTLNNFVLMGCRTYESIGHSLPMRTNIVLTKDKNFKPKGVYVYHSLEKVIENYHKQNNDERDLFIIGGQSVYEQSLPYADELNLTIIHHRFTKADAYFPAIDINEWAVVNHEKQNSDENNLYEYSFVDYKRK